jgi:competence ComEA-like helix-hairpin-helix protein
VLSPSQQRGAITLLALLIVIFALRLWLNPRTIDDSNPAIAPEAGELADKIDPNTATASELAAIPDLGEKRAASIVEFRERFTAIHPNHRACENLDDLLQIPGIGVATVEMMEPYLAIPARAATR